MPLECFCIQTTNIGGLAFENLPIPSPTPTQTTTPGSRYVDPVWLETSSSRAQYQGPTPGTPGPWYQPLTLIMALAMPSSPAMQRLLGRQPAVAVPGPGVGSVAAGAMPQDLPGPATIAAAGNALLCWSVSMLRHNLNARVCLALHQKADLAAK